jgi:hypothetical protein
MGGKGLVREKNADGLGCLSPTSKDNQNFLHARFGLGCDVLKPYKTIIERWLWPDVYKN